MLQARQHAPRFGDFGEVEFGHDDAGLRFRFGEDFAARRDDQGMPVSLPVSVMLAALRRRDDKASGFNRARPRQNVPVQPAGRYGEGGGKW
jgi:hypothetical protein